MWEGKKVTVFLLWIKVFKEAKFVIVCKSRANVEVAMTKSACEFITPLTFQVLTKNKGAHHYVWGAEADRSNIFIVDKTDVAVVVPLTSYTIESGQWNRR